MSEIKRTQSRPGFLKSEERSRKIHVSELQIGMYVSDLDRDWLDTPFLMQGFMIESLEDINTVAEFCEHVWIDSVDEAWVPPEERELIGKHARRGYINKVPVEQEQQRALGTYRAARQITKSLMEEVRLGAAIDTRAAKDLVNECVQSILRNPDALLWIGRMREQDEYTAEHSLNVCILAIAFGRHLGLDEVSLNNLGMCGLLHDVGKMRIPNEVINKPAKLSDKEYKMIQAHTVHGRNLLMSTSGIYQGVVDVAYGHHEKMDGSGYPRRIKATGTSQFARIIAIVDAYDAMTADRCYAPAMTTTKAVNIIRGDRDSHFDGRLADEFIDMIGLYPPGSIVELASGAIGIVISKNRRYRQLPKLMLVRGTKKQPVKERVIDLMKTERGLLGPEYLIAKVHVDGSFGVRICEYREKGLNLTV